MSLFCFDGAKVRRFTQQNNIFTQLCAITAAFLTQIKYSSSATDLHQVYGKKGSKFG
jgi:hypothetical protein